MKKQITILLGLLLFLSVSGQTVEKRKVEYINFPGFHYNFENGVSNRLSIQDIAKFKVSNKFLFSAGLRFHLNQQSGFGSLHPAAEELPIPLPWLYFSAELAHLEYMDYKIGENQIALLAFFLPSKKIRLGIGYAYRSVNMEDNDYHSFFDWSNEMDEGYFIFQFRWLIYENNYWNLAFKLGTYDFMRIQTKDHVFVQFEQQFKIKENIVVPLNISTAIKGISGMVLSVNEFQLETGVMFMF